MLKKIPVIQIAVIILIASCYAALNFPFSELFFSVFFLSSIGFLTYIIFKKSSANLYTLIGIRTVLLWISIFSLFVLYAQLTKPNNEYQFPNHLVKLSGYVSTLDRLPNGSTSFDFKINTINDSIWVREKNISLRCYVDTSLTKYFLMGYGYQLTTVISTLPQPDNFSEFDYGNYLLQQHIYGIILQKEIQSIKLSEPDNSIFYQIVGWLRFKIEYIIIDNIPDLLTQSIVRGLLLGLRSWIPDHVSNYFNLTGTMHVLAVSGLHVAFLTMLVFTPLIRLRKYFPIYGESFRIVITILVLIFYGYLTGWPIGIVRADIMASIFLISSLVKTKKSVWSSFALAVICVLVYNPNQITEPGFLLSFGAVLGIILLSRNFQTTSNIASTLLVSITAILFTAPITMFYFNTVSLSAVIANLFIIPLTTLIFLLGLIMVIIAPISHFLAGMYGQALSFLTYYAIEINRILSTIPYGSVSISETNYVVKLLIIILPILFTFLLIKKYKLFNFLTICTVSGTIIFNMIRPKESTISFLYNGQGDCTMIKTSNHSLIVIDAGPIKSETRKNSAVIKERMQRWGFESVSYFFLTHPHLDHYGGITDTTKPIRINHLVLGDTVGASLSFHNLIRFYQNKGTEITLVKNTYKLNLTNNEKIYAYNLPYFDLNLNNQSLIIKYKYQNNDMLILGDGEKEQEAIFLSSLPTWFFKSDIFKVSHHGSRTSSMDQVTKMVNPTYAIVSVGKINKYRLPNTEVIDKWKTNSHFLFETRFTGEIQFQTDGNNVTYRLFRKQ